jgi:hypothetical protein
MTASPDRNRCLVQFVDRAHMLLYIRSQRPWSSNTEIAHRTSRWAAWSRADRTTYQASSSRIQRATRDPDAAFPCRRRSDALPAHCALSHCFQIKASPASTFRIKPSYICNDDSGQLSVNGHPRTPGGARMKDFGRISRIRYRRSGWGVYWQEPGMPEWKSQPRQGGLAQ